MPEQFTSEECKALHARAVSDMKAAQAAVDFKAEKAMKRLAIALAEAATVLEAVLQHKIDQGTACIDEFVASASDETMAETMSVLVEMAKSNDPETSMVGKFASHAFLLSIQRTQFLRRSATDPTAQA